jgi:hypothetical protein
MTKYPAGPGYDLATGWGSVDANALVTNWSNVQFTPQIAFSANFYSANPVAPGSSLSFTVQFSNSTSGPAPFGTLNILDGSTSLWSATPSVGAGALVTLNTPTAPFSVGTHNLTLTYSGDANWLAASSNTITVTIANPDFALTVNPSVSVVRGAAARVSISTSSIAGFAGSMSLSCSGLPAETSYSFSPASPTVSSGANLTITTTAPRTASLRQGQRPRRVSWPASTGLILSGVVLLAGGRGRRRYWYVALALLLAAFLIADVGCGGGSTSSTNNSAATQASTSDAGTPTGTYTVTVTATSGALTHSTTFSLTVN